jgi:hypothetical protein
MHESVVFSEISHMAEGPGYEAELTYFLAMDQSLSACEEYRNIRGTLPSSFSSAKFLVADYKRGGISF